MKHKYKKKKEKRTMNSNLEDGMRILKTLGFGK